MNPSTCGLWSLVAALGALSPSVASAQPVTLAPINPVPVTVPAAVASASCSQTCPDRAASAPADAAPPVTPQPPDDAPPIVASLDDPPLFGDSQGLIYVRDAHDFIRLYPHAEVAVEAHGFFGGRIPQIDAEQAGVDLGPRFFVRHSRFELGGEVLKRLAFSAAFDLVQNPAIDGAAADGRKTRVALDEAWGYIDAGRGLGLMMGVFQAPFSLENRSRSGDLAFMERSLATRSLAVPAPKVLGVAITGQTYQEALSWAFGAFGAEALTPGRFERGFDLIGRVGFEPLHASRNSCLRLLHFGASVRTGTRNPRDNQAPAPAITTRQGFALWGPSRLDAAGNLVQVLQTGNQYGVGLELRVPSKFVVLRSEGYWASRDTRETVAGPSGLNGLRGGRLSGLAFYAELSFWPLAGPLESEPPALGQYPRPAHLELSQTKPYRDLYGFEVALQAGGIRANYDAASRSGAPDPSSPGSHLRVWDLGVAANYWHTARFKLGVNANWYLTPGSGGPDNLAAMPSNLGGSGIAELNTHHLVELAGRATLRF